MVTIQHLSKVVIYMMTRVTGVCGYVVKLTSCSLEIHDNVFDF